jgi:hypothetical protein
MLYECAVFSVQKGKKQKRKKEGSVRQVILHLQNKMEYRIDILARPPLR